MSVPIPSVLPPTEATMQIITPIDLHSPIRRTRSAPITTTDRNNEDIASRPSTPPLSLPRRTSSHSHYSGGSRRAIITLLQVGHSPKQLPLISAPAPNTINQWVKKWNTDGIQSRVLRDAKETSTQIACMGLLLCTRGRRDRNIRREPRQGVDEEDTQSASPTISKEILAGYSSMVVPTRQ